MFNNAKFRFSLVTCSLTLLRAHVITLQYSDNEHNIF